MTQQEDKCVAGCKHFTGGEVRHHKHCPFYPDSFSKMYDKMKQKDYSNRQKLLDDFAKVAMQASMSNEDLRKALILDARQAELSVDEYIARDAYNIASAMMQERERRVKE